MDISENISYAEATKSQTAIRRGIDNTPSTESIINMKMVAEDCFEPIRKEYGKPIGISSFYRSPELNSAIGGSASSAHCAGQAPNGAGQAAIDIDADIFNNGITNREIFYKLIGNRPQNDFDQLIWEYGGDPRQRNTNPEWVHISKRKHGNRGEILRAIRYEVSPGRHKTKYIPFDGPIQ